MPRARALVAIASMLVLASQLPAAATPAAELWTSDFAGGFGGLDEAWDVAVSPSGAMVFATGQTETASGGDLRTIAYDAATGEVVWSRGYDGTARRDDQGPSLAVDPAGARVYITATSRGVAPAGYDVVTIAYDAATGARLWGARYNSVGNKSEYGVGIAAGAERVYVAVSGGDATTTTIGYAAATGSRLWVATGGRRVGHISSIAARGSRVYVGGMGIGTAATGGDFLTIAYASRTGAKIWNRSYDGGHGNDSVQNMALSADGTSLYVTGTSDQQPYRTVMATVAYRASTGAKRWQARTALPAEGGYDDGPSVSVSPDGSRVFVGGDRTDQFDTHHFLLVAYDAADGGAIWKRVEDGSGHSGYLADIKVAPDGSVVYAGGSGSAGFGNGGLLISAYSAASGGPSLWDAVSPVPSEGYWAADAIAVHPAGDRIFLAGMAGSDFRTVGFATT